MTSIPVTDRSSGCNCGHEDEALPELDARVIPHAIRHASISGCARLPSPRSGDGPDRTARAQAVARPDAERYGDGVEVSYLVQGPDEWKLSSLAFEMSPASPTRIRTPSPPRPSRSAEESRGERAAVRIRVGLVALGGLSLLSGLNAALLLLGVWAPIQSDRLADVHGPVMVLGFLGTLIAIERAQALRRTWAYLAPLLLGLGALTLVFGGPSSSNSCSSTRRCRAALSTSSCGAALRGHNRSQCSQR